MNPKILYRDIDTSKEETDAIRNAGLLLTYSRMEISKNDLVIGRYSVLPYYKEQENDIKYVGAELINSFHQHIYIADLSNWIDDLKDYTPRTWSRLEDLPDNMSFVLKGETNSKKQEWKTSMFAKDKKAAIEVHSRLCSDSLIGYQDIYIREYVPLKTYMLGIQDLPITKEFRFFVMYGQVIAGGYYWSNYFEDLEEKPDIKDVPKEFLDTIISIVGNKSNFYVIDVAETAVGDWIVIELNDGQMSGNSCIDVNEMYINMKRVLDEKK